MSRKPKIPGAEKIEIVEAALFENQSLSEVSERTGIARRALRDWVSRYRLEGRTAFLPQEKNRVYKPEEKVRAVEEYLSGKVGIQRICEKYANHGCTRKAAKPQYTRRMFWTETFTRTNQMKNGLLM